VVSVPTLITEQNACHTCRGSIPPQKRSPHLRGLYACSLCYYGRMQCPFCEHPIIDHQDCWRANWLGRQQSFLFTDVEEETHTVEGHWHTKTVSINGRELSGSLFLDFMHIDPLWDWEDSQENYEDELATWDQRFSWGDESTGAFFLSLALQRWITMRMSLMQQYFYPIVVTLPQADFSLVFRHDEMFRAWRELEGTFREDFMETLSDRGFKPMEEQ
jgi:hypothetical protein